MRQRGAGENRRFVRRLGGGGVVVLGLVLTVGMPAASAQSYSFTAYRPALPAGASSGVRSQASLASLSCPASSQCYAVGVYQTAGGEQPLIEQGPVGHLSPATLSLPSGGVTGSLSSVSCASTTYCVAVGSYLNAASDSSALLYVGESGAWTEVTVPEYEGNPVYELSEVACSTSTSIGCVATDDSNYFVDEVASTWTTSPIPPPPSGEGNYDTIGCDSNECVLAGYTYLGGDPGNYASLPIISVGAGTSWATSLANLPASADTAVVPGNSSGFLGISCVSTTCWAVGNYRKAHAKYIESVGLFEKITTTGTSSPSETPKAVPQPSGSNADPATYLERVSCPTAVSCTAAGYFYTSAASFETVVADFAGGPVSETEIPGSDFNAGQMSCTKTVCLIDPNYGDPIAGDGATWSMVPAAAPSGSSGPQQSAPACVAPSRCYAVGEFTNAKAGTDPLANVLTTVPGS